MHSPDQTQSYHCTDPQVVHNEVTLRRDGDVLMVDVDGLISQLPEGSANAYVTHDGHIEVTVYATLRTRQAHLLDGDVES